MFQKKILILGDTTSIGSSLTFEIKIGYESILIAMVGDQY